MNKTEIRLVGLDCDGTLFAKHGRLTPYAESVLRQLKERGILIVICTGRPWYNIKKAIDPSLYDYAVCENGRLIRRQNGELIEEKRSLYPEEIREISRLVEKYSVMMSCAYEEEFHHFTSKRHHLYVSSVQKLKNVARWMLGRRLWSDDMHSDYEKLTGYDISKICFTGMPAPLRKLADDVDQSRYTVLFTSPMWLEIQPYGMSKGDSLQKIMAMEHIEKEASAAVGDGENDLSMILSAGTSVAMKNAMSALKEAASYITEYHCVDDGCAKWLDAYILQNHGENTAF